MSTQPTYPTTSLSLLPLRGTTSCSSSSRFGPGGFSEDDERSIITGHSDKEAFVTALQSYVTSMKERCLDAQHPPMDWLSNGFSMILLDQEQLVTVPPDQSSLAAVRDMVRHKLEKVWQLQIYPILCNLKSAHPFLLPFDRRGLMRVCRLTKC